MVMIKRKPTTISFLILSMFFYACAFFIFIFIVNDVLLDFLSGKKISISIGEVKNLAVVSIIVGVGAGLGSWIFAKIDEHKARKSPPSDPE